ncbi:hypothetical protein QAD02_021375 [Eretmocerus hayati]|uniref:Uncharacterized protein n=1 Tax=Eretmocerus hayati TaxID=131215 RepID=A0ACC2PQ98_9HYME|nr:hypothetical protein QAD02_021375 [Eretmocerus hayati]
MLAACIKHFKKSFTAQRYFINSVKLRKVSDLLVAWPCLSVKLFLSHHFQELTGCNLDRFTTRYRIDEPKILAYDGTGPEHEGPPIAREISIVLDGHLLIRNCGDMVDGLKCLLAVYFTMNRTYPEGTARTLEFFQRNFLNIAPVAARCRDKNKVKRVETLIALINDLRIIPRV